MDIPALSTAMSSSQLKNDVGTIVLNKSLNTLEVLGQGMVKMMEQSVTPELGGNIDISL